MSVSKIKGTREDYVLEYDTWYGETTCSSIIRRQAHTFVVYPIVVYTKNNTGWYYADKEVGVDTFDEVLLILMAHGLLDPLEYVRLE